MPCFHVLGARCSGNPGTARDPLCSPPAPASLRPRQPQLQPLMTPPTPGNSQAQGSTSARPMHAKPRGVGCSESTTCPPEPHLTREGPTTWLKPKEQSAPALGAEPHKINDFGKWHIFCYIHCCVDKPAFVLPHPQLWSHTSSKVLRRAKRACWGLELHGENRHQQPAPAWCVLAHCNRAIFSCV